MIERAHVLLLKGQPLEDVRLPALRRKMRAIMNVRPSVETMVLNNKAFKNHLRSSNRRSRTTSLRCGLCAVF